MQSSNLKLKFCRIQISFEIEKQRAQITHIDI
jgi:hypothetical protein